jgi:hypothetical protein
MARIESPSHALLALKSSPYSNLRDPLAMGMDRHQNPKR